MDPVTAVYCDDNMYCLSPSREHYPTVIRDYILPHLDVHTSLTVGAFLDGYESDDSVEVEFKMIPRQRESDPPLFAVTNCEDYDFLRAYVTAKHLVDHVDLTESYLWTRKDLFEIMCLGERIGCNLLSKDGYFTNLLVDDSDDEDMDIPEIHKLIGYLGRGDQHIQNPLDLLPINEPQRPGEEHLQYVLRVQNARFWEKRQQVWEMYVRLHHLDAERIGMIPELYEPFDHPDLRVEAG